ncbi:AAA family ATPase [Streptomyces goshikiensis]|uniref:AAA family ATPase n=1 Tax=Streptomyces goshikiensis TaxID=1942 RepID=UPI0036A861F9
MITPIRIRVRNIRSIADAEIRIPETGITALFGAVGSGKSTFLSAMVWALYGEVPGGLKQADMRRTGADGESCEAEVEFSFNGQTFTALRGLRQRTTRGAVREEAYARWWALGASGAGQDERQISPTKLNQKITELTGLTGRAYCGAFFIAQGQLTDLAEGTPAQVQQLFEEQTGLGLLTKEVERRNAEARQAEELAASMPGSREDTDAARQALDAAQDEAVRAHEEHTDADARAQESAARLRDAEAGAAAVEKRHRAAEEKRITRARLGERIRHHEQRQTALEAQVNGVDIEALGVLGQRLTALRAAASSAELALGKLQVARSRAEEAKARAREAQTQMEAVADPDLDRLIAEAQDRRTTHEQQRAVLQGEYMRLNRAVEALTTSDAACCPTCVQPLRDVRALVTHLSDQRVLCVTEGKNAKAKAEAAAQLHDALVRRHQQQDQAHARLEAVQAEAATAAEHVEAVRLAADPAVAAAAGLLPGPVPTDPEQVLAQCRTVIDQLGEDVSHARQMRGLRTELADTETALAAARAELAGLTTASEPSSNELGAATAALATARANHSAAVTASADANTRFQVTSERAGVLGKAHEEATTRMRAKAERLHEAHILHTAAALLTQFRRALLAEYTAAVSQAATDVLTQITDRHTRFEIDQDFAPRVHTAEGTVRPTRVLSGGEKATAALAFRLGITEQITGGTATGMIIADEITAAHDADTRRAVLTCLAELGWPALVVSHGEEITEAAQHVITLAQPDESTGTVISAAA